MIEVKKLAKRYEGGEALCGIDFSVKTGEICAVIGLDGSGKTTLADLLSGCVEPDSGEIRVCGIDMNERPSEARQHLGYVPAGSAVYEDMTARAAMKFIADTRGMGSREATEMIDEAVRRFKIKDVADKTAKGLAAGARKLVMLAQAAFTGSEAIVIDEPTEGLNPREILEMREAIKGLKKDHAVLLTSKNITEVCDVADRVIVLHDGVILTEGKPNELHRMTVRENAVKLIVRADAEAARKAFRELEAQVQEAEEEGTAEVIVTGQGDLREAAFKAVCAAGLTLLYMAPVEKPLDELLMALDNERQVYAPEKEESGDEGNL